MRRLELGVFMPIGNNGFLISKSAPQYRPSFEMNKRITVLAERGGVELLWDVGVPTAGDDVLLDLADGVHELQRR